MVFIFYQKDRFYRKEKMLSKFTKLTVILLILVGLIFTIPPTPVQAAEFITTDTLWTGTKILDQDVVILDGARLTIADGTTIQANCSDTAPYTSGEDDQRIEIIVENGSLEASSTIFSGAVTSGACWYGLVFRSGTSGTITDSEIMDGVVGISAENADLLVEGSQLHNLSGTSQEMGMGLYLSGADLNAEILDTHLFDITGVSGAVGVDGSNGVNPGDPGEDGTNSSSGGDAVGIYITNSAAPLIQDNFLEQISGGVCGNAGIGGEGADAAAGTDPTIPADSGGAGGDGGNGGNGGNVTGIYINNDAQPTVVGNTLQTIFGANGCGGGNGGSGGAGGAGEDGSNDQAGGEGGIGGAGGAGGNGGDGGGADAIYHAFGAAAEILNNQITQIWAGTGGSGGNSGQGGKGGDGGNGGNATASSSGFHGGCGGLAGMGGLAGDGGQGGVARAFFSEFANPSQVSGNIFSTISGGDGGAGGWAAKGGDGGNGGVGGITFLTIGKGGAGGAGGSGKQGWDGGYAGAGGSASGIVISNGCRSISCTIVNNDIAAISAGGGGIGGRGGNGGDGGDGGYGGSVPSMGAGGDGGNGGDGGDGSDGGNAGEANGLNIIGAAPLIINNTLVEVLADAAGGAAGAKGNRGYGGTFGDGDPSGDLGSIGEAGSRGTRGYGNESRGVQLVGTNGTDLFNNIMVMTTPPGAGNAIGLLIGDETALSSMDHNLYWGWDTTYETSLAPGANDVTADPVFVSAADHHLQFGSPAVDAGTDEVTGVPDVDLDGAARPQDGLHAGTTAVDLGAYEYWAASVTKSTETSGPLAVGQNVTYTVTLDLTGIPASETVSLLLTETVPTGLSYQSPADCSVGSVTENAPVGFSWSGTPTGGTMVTCTFTARVSSFEESYDNAVTYTDRDGTWESNHVIHASEVISYFPLLTR